MTLNISVATPRVLVAATDRRLTDTRTRVTHTERSTKLTVLHHADGFAFVTYNGIGSIGEVTPGDWLHDLASRESLALLPLSDVLEAIRVDTERRINALPRTFVDRRHSFVLAACEPTGTSIAVVSNYESADSGIEQATAASSFSVSRLLPVPGHEVSIIATGLSANISHGDFERIGSASKKAGAAAVDIKNLCVRAIQHAALSRRRGGIGSSVQWACAESGTGVLVGLDVPDGSQVHELPSVIQPGMQFGPAMVATGDAARAMWERGSSEDESPCVWCGSPVPIGYLACPSCGCSQPRL